MQKFQTQFLSCLHVLQPSTTPEDKKRGSNHYFQTKKQTAWQTTTIYHPHQVRRHTHIYYSPEKSHLNTDHLSFLFHQASHV